MKGGLEFKGKQRRCIVNINDLDTHLRNRPAALKEAKEKGVKIIGYFPGNYVPEEIIYASGAIPICLTDGGNSHPAETALSVVPHIICPFARAQLGEKLLKTNPYYDMIDMLVAPITCQHLKKVAEVWEYQEDIKIFKLGIPHQYDGDFELEYFTDRLKALKERLEAFTGNEITNKTISEAIRLYNRMRELFKKISLMRRSPSPPISVLDFVKLNHASFYADPVFMVDALDSLHKGLEESQPTDKSTKPRLLLVGPNLANGDYEILKLIEAAGGEVVAEELCEGMRYYWHSIENNGDPFQSLAKGYLMDRVPCAFMRSSAKKRLDFTLKLIADFRASGMIWYELQCCEAYDQESYYFSKKMNERNIPMLIVESNYDVSDAGPLRNRIDAFIELVKGGPVHA
jgi:benzoyl-CoA reductase/2-hydroxyglutaryl-CoA dehydratase subunit BcrC/BadD/HgdB